MAAKHQYEEEIIDIDPANEYEDMVGDKDAKSKMPT